MLKTNPLKLTTMHNKLFSDRGIKFLAPENGKYQKLTKTLRNLEKSADFNLKNANFRDIKILNTNPLLL